jgi:hypothetical protein
MSDITPVNALDALNSDLSSVEAGFPTLEAGTYDCIIADMKVIDQKAPKTGKNLEVTLKTAQQARTHGPNPTTKAPGFPLRDIVGLSATEKYDPRQRLAAIKLAVLGNQDGAFGTPEMYIGKPVTVRIKVESSAEYGDQNRVQAYVQRRS